MFIERIKLCFIALPVRSAFPPDDGRPMSHTIVGILEKRGALERLHNFVLHLLSFRSP